MCTNKLDKKLNILICICAFRKRHDSISYKKSDYFQWGSTVYKVEFVTIFNF